MKKNNRNETAEQIEARIERLRKRIEEAENRLRNEELLLAYLQPIFDEHPGITTGEAIELFNKQAEEHRRKAGR